jgi:RNA polymerase sigma-70 factor (ECF subfamily)
MSMAIGARAQVDAAPERMVTADDLVERLRRGDADAVGTAYDLHHAVVRAFARRLLDDGAAAEDLVHEVFVALPKAIRSFRGESSLRTFLISIAVRRAQHHVRSATRRRAAMERLAREPARTSAATDPERAAQGEELARALARALDRIPVEQRVAFVLCDVEERTSDEAARIAGVPDATMRTRLFHARRKLRLLLAEEGIR